MITGGKHKGPDIQYGTYKAVPKTPINLIVDPTGKQQLKQTKIQQHLKARRATQIHQTT